MSTDIVRLLIILMYGISISISIDMWILVLFIHRVLSVKAVDAVDSVDEVD